MMFFLDSSVAVKSALLATVGCVRQILISMGGQTMLYHASTKGMSKLRQARKSDTLSTDLHLIFVLT